MDASDGSDIEEFTDDEPSLSSSQAISEFSQSQSVLGGTQNVEQNVQSGSVIGGVVISDVVEVLESSDLRSKVDVDLMVPYLASVKLSRSRDPRPERNTGLFLSPPQVVGGPRGLPIVLRYRPN